MSRILLVDDSPHAQRIGERILTDEGFEVVTVSNADSALIRLDDAEPDVVIAKAVMPGRSGFEICRFIKMSPRHRHVRVIVTAGAMETLDEDEVARSGADGTLRKPFEATALLEKVRPLAEAAEKERGAPAAANTPAGAAPAAPRPPEAKLTAPVIAVIDPEQVRAAVTVALDASMAILVEEISQRVLASLISRKPGEKIETRAIEPPGAGEAASSHDAVRTVTRASGLPGSPAARPHFRPRSGSILGLNLPEPEQPSPNTGKPDAE
jgi:CheY-like chemotaxis protein